MIARGVIRLKLPPHAGVDNADLLRMLLLRSQQTTAQHAHAKICFSALCEMDIELLSDSLKMDKPQFSLSHSEIL